MSGASAVTGTGTRFQTTKPYKALVAVLGAFVLAITAVISDGIHPAEWAQVVVAVSTALTIWLAANLPGFTYTKGIVAFIGALTNLGVAYLTGEQITSAEWWNLLVVALIGIGVVVVPNPVSTVGTTNTGRPVGERGAYEPLYVIGILLLVVGLAALVLTLLEVASVPILACIIVAVIGLVLLLLSRRGTSL